MTASHTTKARVKNLRKIETQAQRDAYEEAILKYIDPDTGSATPKSIRSPKADIDSITAAHAEAHRMTAERQRQLDDRDANFLIRQLNYLRANSPKIRRTPQIPEVITVLKTIAEVVKNNSEAKPEIMSPSKTSIEQESASVPQVASSPEITSPPAQIPPITVNDSKHQALTLQIPKSEVQTPGSLTTQRSLENYFPKPILIAETPDSIFAVTPSPVAITQNSKNLPKIKFTF